MDRRRRRAVARLADGRLPAARQPLAGRERRRVAEQLVEDVAEEMSASSPDDGVADRRVAPAASGRSRDGRALGVVERDLELGRDEPPERGEERDRCGLRERQPVELVGREAADPLEDGRDPLRPSVGGRRTVGAGPGHGPGRAPGRRDATEPGSRSPRSRS